MLTTAIVNSIAVLFAFGSNFKTGKYALFASVSVIFLFMALRYDYGIDYMEYYDAFEEISYLSFAELHEASLVDWGYVFSNWLFARLGMNFFCFVAVVTLFQCFVLYRTIRQYVPNEYHWLAITIYLFNPSMMLIQCSALRQSIAIFLFLYSIRFIIEKKLLWFIACIVIGGFFHRSCLFMLPLYWLCGSFKINKYAKFLLAGLYWILFFKGNLFIYMLSPIINYVNPRYLSTYDAGGQVGTGFFIIFYFLCLLWWLYQLDAAPSEMKVYMKVSIIFFVTLVLGVSLMMFARIGHYFVMSLIITIPFIIRKLPNPLLKTAVAGGFVLLYFYTFYCHFQDEFCSSTYIYKTFLFE